MLLKFTPKPNPSAWGDPSHMTAEDIRHHAQESITFSQVVGSPTQLPWLSHHKYTIYQNIIKKPNLLNFLKQIVILYWLKVSLKGENFGLIFPFTAHHTEGKKCNRAWCWHPHWELPAFWMVYCWAFTMICMYEKTLCTKAVLS